MGVVALVFAAFTSSASAGAAENPTAYAKNKTCADFGYTGEFKIDAQPEEGTYTDGDVKGNVPEGFYVEISNVVIDDEGDEKSVTFDWASFVPDGDDEGDGDDPSLVSAVMVKFANGGLIWVYSEGASADTAWSTKDSISHVNFCFGNLTTTTSVDDSTTSSVEDTTTSVDGTTTSLNDTSTTDGTDGTRRAVSRSAGGGAKTLPRTGLVAMLPLIETGFGLVLLGTGMIGVTRKNQEIA